MSEDLGAILEGLLFAAEGPLNLGTLAEVIGTGDQEGLRRALESLAEEYENRGGGFYLQQVAGGYQLRSRPRFHPWIRRLRGIGAPRLSRAALETLAIVAYRQPVVRAEIEAVRGVDCGGVLRMLLERRLIRVMGRREIPGRPLLYGTTRIFLEVFELRDLKDLPTLKEIKELSSDPGQPVATGSAADCQESVPLQESGKKP
jgi:segregation and condensation protein B